MKNKLLFILFTLGCLAFGVSSFETLEYPDFFPAPVYDLDKNPLTKEKIALGQALFYDPILSKNQTISCASCHSPFNAFAHTDHDLSHGINDQIGTRNAPALFNLAWQKTFMWDGAVNHLDVQALAPLSHPLEMNENIVKVVQKLQSHSKYPKLFFEAFQDSIITGEHFLKALAQFQLTLISSNSKYDEVKKGQEQFSPQEQNGYILFQKNCNGCHTEPLFTNHGFANNGLPIDSSLHDYGKGMITQKVSDSLLFKIPSLRNLSYTFPYMHDGRFQKLNQVLQHYTNPKSLSPNLAIALEKPIALSSNEKVDLIAFLLTLNDKKFVFDPKHQFPRNFFFQKNN